jgi:hypothetical protein
MAMTQPIIPGVLRSRGYVQITDLTVAVGISPPALTEMAVINVTGGTINWRDDGVNPTASVGMALTTGSYFIYNGPYLAFRAIAVSGTPVLNVSYYTRP